MDLVKSKEESHPFFRRDVPEDFLIAREKDFGSAYVVSQYFKDLVVKNKLKIAFDEVSYA